MIILFIKKNAITFEESNIIKIYKYSFDPEKHENFKFQEKEIFSLKMSHSVDKAIYFENLGLFTVNYFGYI